MPSEDFTIPILHATYPVLWHKFPDETQADATWIRFQHRKPKKERAARCIRIDPRATTSQIRAALWHEAFHVMFHEYGREDLAKSEALVEAMGQAVMRIREELPWL
ncbi:MAG TPA: hypothetical protein VE222_05380 [Nitrospiraceae bacterium]|jgi:hypothetical protein|nr:hypothetical protein [Nitrospiraceae bacterium]